MALNPSGAISLGGPSTGQSIAVELGLSPTAQISLNQTNVRTLAQVPSGTIIMPTNFWGKSVTTATQKAIFGYGRNPTYQSMTNLVSNTGVVASDTPGVGTARQAPAAAGYGGDKAIFGYGRTTGALSVTNLVSNAGVVASDTPGVGTARFSLAGTGYGGDKAIFGFGQTAPTNTTVVNMTNLVSNTGVVASDTPGVGTARSTLAGAGYGGDKAIYRSGLLSSGTGTNVSNLVSNTGVVASNTPGVGILIRDLAAAGYGGDKAIFGFGRNPPSAPSGTNITNLVSNTGVVASNTPTVGTARAYLAAAGYGGDKAIFGFGASPTIGNITNLVSNAGVVAANNSGVGTARIELAAAGYSST